MPISENRAALVAVGTTLCLCSKVAPWGLLAGSFGAGVVGRGKATEAASPESESFSILEDA